jgi:transposase InsO family protein
MDTYHHSELARAALCTAIAIRGGSVAGLVFHTDQDGEYTGGPAHSGRTREAAPMSLDDVCST